MYHVAVFDTWRVDSLYLGRQLINKLTTLKITNEEKCVGETYGQIGRIN